jgi:hypothetical protein
MPAQYTIISQRPIIALNPAGNPQRAVEITFTYGQGFTGQVVVDENTSNTDSIRQSILDYITRFTVSDGG